MTHEEEITLLRRRIKNQRRELRRMNIAAKFFWMGVEASRSVGKVRANVVVPSAGLGTVEAMAFTA